MNSMNKKAFTLIELLVVVAMIAVLLGALTTSVTAARKRARIQKATADVKVITQAILAYEQWAVKSGKDMPEYDDPTPCNSGNLNFLLGKEAADNGGQIPVMLMAQLQAGGDLLDPWGHPYQMTIRRGNASVSWSPGNIKTGYQMPNYYRLGEGERHVEER